MINRPQDIEYKIQREKLIPAAENLANSKLNKYQRRYSKSVRSLSKAELWNKYFHAEMERLCIKTGITTPKQDCDI